MPPRRSRNHSDILRGAGLSFLAHGALLLVIGRAATQPPPSDAETIVASAGAIVPEEGSLAWVDVVAPPTEEVAAVLEPTKSAAAVTGDETRLVEDPTAPRRGVNVPAAAPAPDSGDGQGRPRLEATRKDLSTLRARLSDGADVYHGEQERTGARAASPQPIRQEPTVGIGDSSRTRERAAEEHAPDPAVAGGAEGPTETDLQVSAPTEMALAAAEARDRARGEGPLDAAKGRRMFDVETAGAASDNRWQRAASDQLQPGRFELSSPSVAGRERSGAGHGPAETPGAVSAPSAGTAPSVAGAEQDVPQGALLALSTAEREYQRTPGEIGRRVQAALKFPKHLALMLEQGETVVRFVVRPDGRLAGTVQVVKSAGFDEFDAAAVSAVNHAAPFPAPGRALTVSMPIAFFNPVVR